MRLGNVGKAIKLLFVSIHAPWEGCDSVGDVARLSSAMFQFTHPGKGATDVLVADDYDTDVSIHAPWEGCDHLGLWG